MSDTLQRLLRWPLWSWRNLTITTVALLAALALIGRATSTIGDPQPPTQAAPSQSTHTATAPAAPAPAPVTTTTTPGGTTAPTASQGTRSASCEDTATSFVRAWARPTAGDTWLPGLEPFATPDLLEQLKSVDPAHVPATKVTGEATVTAAGPASTTVRVPTDGGPVAVVLTRAEKACLVSDLEPVNDVPGAPTPALTAVPGQTGG